ncbi:MAG: glycosyltransferase family 4 protein [bacterium]|nr:glycosyltransferase family 4 protein [bacterium]
MAKNPKRLLLIGSTQSDVHLRNFHALIEGYFDEILLVSGNEVDFCDTKVLDFGLKNPLKIRKTISQLRKIIQEFQPTIIHVHQANSYGYITAKANKRKIPQVLTIWGSDVLLLPKKSSVHRRLVKKALQGAHKITADAGFIQKNVSELIGPHDFTTANFGIDLPSLKIDLEKKKSIVYSNRLHNTLYNIDSVIDGFAEFHQGHKNWKLVIAGRGNRTAELKKLASSKLPKDAYEFVGFVDYETNMSYYQKASIYISVPSSDGTSVSLLEAMACGTIPIVSDLPANHEWITSGKNGIILKSTVAEALNAALKLDHVYLAAENKAIIEKKATKTANRAIYVKIYKDLRKK